jgi:hypothetical protein
MMTVDIKRFYCFYPLVVTSDQDNLVSERTCEGADDLAGTLSTLGAPENVVAEALRDLEQAEHARVTIYEG